MPITKAISTVLDLNKRELSVSTLKVSHLNIYYYIYMTCEPEKISPALKLVEQSS